MRLTDLSKAASLADTLRGIAGQIGRVHRMTLIGVVDASDRPQASPADACYAPAGSQLEADLRNAWLAELRRRRVAVEMDLIKIGVIDLPREALAPEATA